MTFRPQPLPGDGRPWRRPGPALRLPASFFQAEPLLAFQSADGPSFSSKHGGFDLVLIDFTNRWERGENPRLEDYLDRISPEQSAARVELIYREFCLRGWAGLGPCPEDYLTRFPAEAAALERLFRVDAALGSYGLRLWDGPPASAPLPEVGNEIGPYRLIRELGRGAFARVFLAEQANLDDRLVVVKVSTRVTPEPALLARASHPHIVEVLWHGEADGGALQLICMPFLGGASLSAVLAERRRLGARPGTGRDLLDDLDRVSADGYLPLHAGRPAREQIARLSYPKAAALVVARLAEALDFAFSRRVVHGDVKPSNVLLTADGVPKLLDFNLSVDWRPLSGSSEHTPEAGGTLAYMAPERLRTVAEHSSSLPPTAAERHRADIYSLGVLLLEMLTGRAPELPRCGGLSPQELASFYVSSREHSSELMIRSTHAPLPAGLWSVLSHCLAPNPADRYGHASELAEDLDRWRDDLPLIFAREPGRALGLIRAARRRRRALVTVAIGLVVAAAVTAVFLSLAQTRSRELAERSYSQIFKEESDAFLLRRTGSGRIKYRGSPAEIARRHLDRYGVLEPGVDWRQRTDFRELPSPKREELEVWLLEQSLRFAYALEASPDRSDRQRALVSLEQVAASAPFHPILDECRELRRGLGRCGPPPAYACARGSHAAAAPSWVDEYLYGVEAELRGDSGEAKHRYETVLKVRPGSFWANYRAAAVASKAGDFRIAVMRLRACVDQLPDNAALRHLFAGCLYEDGNYQEAMEQCNKAQRLDPDRAETYETQLFLRIKLGQFQNFAEDAQRYDHRTGRGGRLSTGPPSLDLAGSTVGDEGDLVGLATVPPLFRELDPDEIDVRNTLAYQLQREGRHEIALGQFDRVLEMDPGDLTARYGRAVQRGFLRRGHVDQDFALVTQHPQIESLVRKRHTAIYAFHHTTSSLIRQGKAQEAVDSAKRGVLLSDRFECMQAESYFKLAQGYALGARSDPSLVREALENLSRAYHYDPAHSRSWYLSDPLLKNVRAEHGLSPFLDR